MPDNDDFQAPPRGPAPSLGLGERLRSARKAKALSVHQVADALRLEEASVVALEDERFEVMGAAVFVRGHLKRYAQLVGLSPEAVLEAYRAVAPQSDAPPSLARAREQADAVRIGPWAYWLAGAVVLLGVIIALSGGEDEVPVLVPAAPVFAPDTAPVTGPAPAPSAPVPATHDPAGGPADAAVTAPAAAPGT